MKDKSHRNTILVEEAKILSNEKFPGDQYVMRVDAPGCASKCQPGQFVHLTVDPKLLMRRPMSIMRASKEFGWVDFLYKAIGEGTKMLSQRHIGETINIMGPIGKPFTVKEKRPLLIGGGVGMPPMIAIAESLKKNSSKPFIILGSEVPFPFKPVPSQIILPGIPNGVIGAMPLLEDWGIPSRLTSKKGFPGCYDGFVTDLARYWLDELSQKNRREVGVYACGPHNMLRAVVELAKEYNLPVQISLEEYMACAVGGCAGCVVETKTEKGAKMQRICVDGPVFDGYQIFN